MEKICKCIVLLSFRELDDSFTERKDRAIQKVRKINTTFILAEAASSAASVLIPEKSVEIVRLLLSVVIFILFIVITADDIIDLP